MPGRWLPLLLLLALGTAATGQRAVSRVHGAPSDEVASRPVPTYQDDIRPLLDAKCSRCHGEKTHKAGLDLGTLAAILKGGESGPVILPGKPERSLLLEKVHGGSMPPDKKDRLTEREVETIRRWITSGAMAEPGADVAMMRHDVTPILLRRCTACHGLRRQEGGLDLHTRAGMLRGGKSGPAIVPGRPEDSPLVKRIRAGQMPPRDRLVEASVKPMETAETDALVRWIAAGAPEGSVAPDVATTRPDTQVTDKDRDFWAFRPPRPVAVPKVRAADRVRNTIDAFVIHKLEAHGLTLSKEADRLTLLRRAYFDLIGLPPEPAEVKAFLVDESHDAYERLVDRLLASPRYGERWARHWLDLAGYADSEGKREQDLPRPHAWRYRDYVIRSFHDDKPYNRFLLEQLAGDELADYEHAAEITPAIYDNLVATAFLRMTPDATWANITGYVQERIEVIADEMDVLGSGVMGLTLKCARCHAHKFDPIPQRDYFRLVDVFKGAYDEHDWLKPDVRPGLGPVSQDVLPGRHLPHVTTTERQAWEAQNGRRRAEIALLGKALDEKAEALATKILEARLAELPEVLRADLRTMLATAADQRDPIQKYLAGKFERQLRVDRNGLKVLDATFKKEAEDTEGKIQTLRGQLLPEPRIQALWDRGEPSPTYVYRRGDPLQPGRLVGPGVPSVLTDGKTPFKVTPPWPGAKQTGRRLAFARWLTGPDHPLTSRVIVNRLWKHHFGTGIVKSLGNFGKMGVPPSHPELLDWLAQEFRAQGSSFKAMHRLLMTSATYRQASAIKPEALRRDPDNALLSRMPLTRLDAEALYDTMLLVAGQLDERPFGPPDDLETRTDGLATPKGTEHGWRRLIYVRQMRKQVPTHMENFDFPQMNPNCIERRDSTVAPQALHLLNNGMVLRLAEQFAQRVSRAAGADPRRRVDLVYLIALSRPPNAEEATVGVEGLKRLADAWSQRLPPGANAEEADARALTAYVHATMNSAGFLYVD